MIKHDKLEITLMSDLCAGSGYSYAGIVDEDICYDEYGLPFIPGRRIKGCLKEAAEEIDVLVPKAVREKLFGKAKDDSVKGITVGNARIKDYETIRNDIDELRKYKDISGSLTQQDILEEFTSVRGQTAMTDGVADENTLRYVRTVNQYSPFDSNQPLVFLADIFYDDAYDTEIGNIVKALRHIGYNRNRGLGNVRCKLSPAEEGKLVSEWKGGTSLAFELINEEPLMISASNNVDSLKYIPGRSVIGALAASYLKKDKNTADSDEFKSLFLDGSVRYSNIYLCKDHIRCIPVPDFINRMKKTGEYVNNLQYNPSLQYDDKHSPLKGNQPKKLRGKFLSVNSNGGINVEEVKTEIIYHHRRNVEKKLVLLYTQTAISRGQTFKGIIEGPEDKLEIIKDLLMENNLRFGKSKTAQYGKCRVMYITEADKPQTVKLKSGDVLLASAASDLVLMNDTDYSVTFNEVYAELAKELGIDGKYEKPDSLMKLTEKDGKPAPYSILNVTSICGYNSKLNLRRAPVPAIAAGSTFAYRMTEDCTVSLEKSGGYEYKVIGEYAHEGNGEIRLFKMADMPYELSMTENTASGKTLDSLNKVQISQETKTLVTECLMKTLSEKIKAAIQSEDAKGLNLTASKIGRLTLMLKESLSSSADPKTQYCDLYKRIESIKSDDEKRISKSMLKKYIGNDKDIQIDKILNIHEAALKSSAEYTALTKLIGQNDTDSMIKKIWGDILMSYLTVQKYGKKA